MICIVEPEKYCYFKEYLLSLEIEIRFYPCSINKGEKVLVVQKLLDLNYSDASFIGLLNTEQLTKQEWKQYFNTAFQTNNCIHLFDYSKCNVKCFEETYGIMGEHLPYKYREEEIFTLKHLILNTPKEYDVAFIGDPIGRRGELLQSLKDRGVKVNIIAGKWDISRDMEVAKCQVLVNLHFSDEYLIFEEIRCNRWLMAGLIVISEKSIYENEISYKKNLITVEKDKIVETITSYFKYSIPRTILEQALPRIFIFHTDNNSLSENNINCIENIKTTVGIPVVFINPSNLYEWTKHVPLHAAYPYLSYSHQENYLRCYFMHHYGGGYTDIKMQTSSWITSFAKLNTSSHCVGIGYTEVFGGVANIDDKVLYNEMNNFYFKLIGNNAYIFKPNTFFTLEWYNAVNRILDSKYEELKLNTLYPLSQTEILGNIFHPLVYKYNCFVLQGLSAPVFDI
jgi:hypothetical protein